ncbi:hypothetical protein Pmani_018411 [Petrolisthes manimaculis]|uniref:Uncharacterized protein n=1 Tax=Petrolisthes manimaculis TaxID=1843537 RepID=A0AAE1PKE8_9EUCA|nr:hypothetical protein Pmani_018411 [Petrolisthes manimaculis]
MNDRESYTRTRRDRGKREGATMRRVDKLEEGKESEHFGREGNRSEESGKREVYENWEGRGGNEIRQSEGEAKEDSGEKKMSEGWGKHR